MKQKKLEEMRRFVDEIGQDAKHSPAIESRVVTAALYISELLKIVDTQAEQLTNTRETYYKTLRSMDGLVEQLKAKDKQIEKGRGLLVDWTLDCVKLGEEGQLGINECTECRSVIDAWDNGHKEGCEVGAWLKEVE